MSDAFAACFDRFTVSAFRLETLPEYAVPAEDERIAAFRAGRPMPERSVRTSPWLRRIAETTAAGKHWSRTRVVGHPLTQYERFELATYRESADAGEVIRIADRRADPALNGLRRDFWLFDAESKRPFAAVMEYDDAGHYIGAQVTDDLVAVAAYMAERDLARQHSATLAGYLAALEIEAA